ncbi:MAG: hypothetical protein ABW123_27050, partial [Cystobacter sp.]
MKIDGERNPAPPRSTPERERFQELLKKAPPEPLKRAPPGAPVARAPGARARGQVGARAASGPAPLATRSTLARAEHLGVVRQGMSAEIHRLREVRGEAHQSHQERTEQRLTALIARELRREASAEPGPGAGPPPSGRGEPSLVEPTQAPALLQGGRMEGGPAAVTGARASEPVEARVQATLELIEKIEVFVRAQRPALALRLGGALDATVEVERTGARQVALRIQGHRGPLPPEDLTRLREALEAR